MRFSRDTLDNVVKFKTSVNQQVVKNLRIIAQWWTSSEGHLLRLCFGVFQLSVVYNNHNDYIDCNDFNNHSDINDYND